VPDKIVEHIDNGTEGIEDSLNLFRAFMSTRKMFKGKVTETDKVKGKHIIVPNNNKPIKE
jgi:hypothetical protein